ncbi:MAG: ethanolamine utilization protein EutH [Lawsonibacter sp.]|nr:ethanolamine utilization protein EutH [Lawsonibacter sp.]
MIAHHIIQAIISVCLSLGAADFILGGRFHLSEEFTKGICAAGTLLLCMSGYLAIAPVCANLLIPIIAPLCRMTGLDPSVLAGLFFANDSGGAALAIQLAQDPQVGLYNGYVVSAEMGTTVMYTVGLSMSAVAPEQKKYAAYGIACSIIIMPLSCIVGAVVAGFQLGIILLNTIPLMILSVFLCFLLLYAERVIVTIMVSFGKFMTALSMVALAMAAVQELTGITLLSGLEPLSHIYPIVGGIAIFLSGAYPLMAIIQYVFKNQFQKIGNRLCINEASVKGLILSTLNILASRPLLSDMDRKGIMLNLAFWGLASCVFGDHLAFTSQQAPALAFPVLISKLIGGLLACLLALVLYHRCCLREERECA